MSEAAAGPLTQDAVDAAERRFRRRILGALALGAAALAGLVLVSLLL